VGQAAHDADNLGRRTIVLCQPLRATLRRYSSGSLPWSVAPNCQRTQMINRLDN
jgi:hypothetical protein